MRCSGWGLIAIWAADYRIAQARELREIERDRIDKERDEREQERDERYQALLDRLTHFAPDGDLKNLLIQSVAFVHNLWGFIRDREDNYEKGMREKAPLPKDIYGQLFRAYNKATKSQFDKHFRPELDNLLTRYRTHGIDTREVETWVSVDGENLSAYAENIAHSLDSVVQELLFEIYRVAG